MEVLEGKKTLPLISEVLLQDCRFVEKTMLFVTVLRNFMSYYSAFYILAHSLL